MEGRARGLAAEPCPPAAWSPPRTSGMGGRRPTGELPRSFLSGIAGLARDSGGSHSTWRLGLAALGPGF